MTEPEFLTLDDVLAIHESRIQRYGGSTGVRDLGLLQSAMGSVAATFGGEFLHPSIEEMAAAYIFGICRNHPFVDGNKRAALACALTFLRLNGIRIASSEEELYELVIGIAEGRRTKSAAAVFFEKHRA